METEVCGFRFGMVKLQLYRMFWVSMTKGLFPLWHGKVATVQVDEPVLEIDGFRFGMVKLQPQAGAR